MQQSALAARLPIVDLAALRSRAQANSRLVLVEALPAESFATGHLPGAINLPHDATDSVVRATLADYDAEIVTYCASATCPNSHLLAARLSRLGYTDVAVFAEGKAAWLEAGENMERYAAVPARALGVSAFAQPAHEPFSVALHALPSAAFSVASFFRSLIRTDANFAPTIARLTLGLVILPHGAQKLLGWFGGYGFTGTMQWFTGTLHVPWVFGLAAILAETLGGFALIAGFASRLAALILATVFATAVALVHGQHGFFINWFGNQKGEGIEYFILGGALAAIVAVYGGGAASIDRLLARRWPR